MWFPHTRFLRNIQLNSRKQSQVRYKLLLATRLLFLACLVFAFAQPFFNNKQNTEIGDRLQVIYLDNSYSMSVKKGSRTVFDIAKENAASQVKNARQGSSFMVLTNDKPKNYYPIPATKAFEEINNTELSSASKTVNQVLSFVQSMRSSWQGGKGENKSVNLYYYSDFQQNTLQLMPDKKLLQQIYFVGMPIQSDEVKDIFIDTAYLSAPVLQTGKNNSLIVKTRMSGKSGKENPVLQLSINGQVKSAASLNFGEKQESTDTLSFVVNDASWQQIELTVNDSWVKFDDTFRITARSAPNLSVLVINEGQPNPYIQAAFRAYNGFRLNQTTTHTLPSNFGEYNLVILNGITGIDASLEKIIIESLEMGQSICIFPGKTTNFNSLNEGLKQTGIQIVSLDTSVQTAGNLQQGNDLVKELFEKIPENVQLPVANWHYSINSILSANRQSILSFRNGDPFLARYTPFKGQLYLCATSADLQSGNFTGSYFFTPFLYQMAVQSSSNSIYALTIGQQQAVFLPLKGVKERNAIHVMRKDLDFIPPQRTNGAGVDLLIDQTVQQPGFYNLLSLGNDTTKIALNQDKNESQLDFWDIKTLKSNWNADNINWIDMAENNNIKNIQSNSNFPLWKIFVLFALVMLAAETFLLAKRKSITA